MSGKLVFVGGNKNYSSWTVRAWLALHFAGLEFDDVLIPLFTPGYKERIHEYGAAGKVPLLKNSSGILWDSMAICEYAAEQAPGLWPADPAGRGQARSICMEMHSGFTALRSELPMNARATGRLVEISGECRADIDRIQQIWAACLRASGGPWLYGRVSIADACFAPVVSRFATYGIQGPEICSHYGEHLLADR